MKRYLLAATLAVFAQVAVAEDETHYVFDGSFDDAVFSLENAIVGRGLVIDYHTCSCCTVYSLAYSCMLECTIGCPYLVKNASRELLFWNSLCLGA